jgi:biofilm protein TabA
MIHAKINDPNLDLVLAHPIWKEALDWIRMRAATADLGISELRGKSMFVNVMEYNTESRENCRFESHRRYLDVQYTIAGVEGIDYYNRAELENEGGYNLERDLLFHKAPDQDSCTLAVTGDRFCVFFPEDAHRPKVAIGEPGPIRKLVVKIDLELLKS